MLMIHIILEKPGDTQSPGFSYFAPPFAIQIKSPINTANAAMTAIKIQDLRGPLGERYTFAVDFTNTMVDFYHIVGAYPIVAVVSEFGTLL